MSPDLEIESIELNSASSPVSRTLAQSANADQRLEQQMNAALALLQTGDFNQRWDAVKRLSGLGEAVVPPLMQLLIEEAELDWELLWFIARILGSLNSPTAVAALIQLLEATDQPDVVAMAIMALGHCGETAIAPLSDLLARPDTRLLAVQALAQIPSLSIVPPLLTVVQDDAVDVRAAVLEAFSRFYHPTITATFRAALTDLAAPVRQTAVTAIGLQAAAYPEVDWIETLKPLLWDFNLNVCAQTAMACARIGTPAAVTSLMEVLQSLPTPNLLRLEIIRALAWIGNPAALVALQQFLLNQMPDQVQPHPSTDLSQSDLALEQEVVTALGRVTHPESQKIAVEILLHLLHLHHPITKTVSGKQQIALSLGQLKAAEAIDPLIHLLVDTNASVQFHIVAALKQLGNPAYQRLQFWQTAAPDQTALQTGIALALQEWTDVTRL
jgi:HEAT repeat protein